MGHQRHAVRAVHAQAVREDAERPRRAGVQRRRAIGNKSVEVDPLITSADRHAAPQSALAAWAQGHWEIKNASHQVRNVTYDQDRSQVRTGNAPRIMAILRNTATSLLRFTGRTNIAEAPTSRQGHHTTCQPTADLMKTPSAGAWVPIRFRRKESPGRTHCCDDTIRSVD